MNVWLQLVLTMAGVAGVVLGAGRWLLRGLDARVGAVVRAETGPQFAQIREQFVQVRAEARDEFAQVRAEMAAQFAVVHGQLGDVRHQAELTNLRLGSLEGDMSLVKQRLLGVA